jgi:hypothetical protein
VILHALAVVKDDRATLSVNQHATCGMSAGELVAQEAVAAGAAQQIVTDAVAGDV